MSSPRPITTLESFGIGGLAACTAYSAEVAKTRLQLQGELQSKGTPKVYKNVFDVFFKTWRNEGIRGVQRGLGPAYVYQVLLNGSRLGFYEPFRRMFNSVAGLPAHEQMFATSIAAGAASGLVGACLGNPLFLIKARMQAYSPALPVGTQHYYRNSFAALREIFKAEGLRGYIRGMDAAILRTCMGSSVQLPSYNWTKTMLVKHGIGSADSTWTFLASSMVSGICVVGTCFTSKAPFIDNAAQCLAMQPADTALTRMYNQPTIPGPNGRMIGALYKNPIDCLWKTLKTEGALAWYKGLHSLFVIPFLDTNVMLVPIGSTAHFLRIAP
ncbi:Mitochondrial oxaloacetate transport protein [Ceratobasidium theobromae]|uniref:Mitochondrial oxaloacetate transport protein n=1 Tax=Ceratobasidium theobromae TaxID=1582974 RepID=A0A5N5QF23_9AGAM|nr:Mitochondrial oxaloacetate transport protein [Ceratobasidium theobromae]